MEFTANPSLPSVYPSMEEALEDVENDWSYKCE